MIIDYVKNLPDYQSLLPDFSQWSEVLERLTSLDIGRHDLVGEHFMMIAEGETQPLSEGQYEFHRRFLDIQIMLEGQEVMKWQNLSQLNDAIDYDEANDIGFLVGDGETITIEKQMFYIVFPEDAHMPSRHIDVANRYKKAIIKLKL